MLIMASEGLCVRHGFAMLGTQSNAHGESAAHPTDHDTGWQEGAAK
jgi:hypothetical protein